jgi:hypothetical protein
MRGRTVSRTHHHARRWLLAVAILAAGTSRAARAQAGGGPAVTPHNEQGRVVVPEGATSGSLRSLGDRPPCTAPSVSRQPDAGGACPTGTLTFGVGASGSGPLRYQWQVQTAPDVWEALGAGPLVLSCGGDVYPLTTLVDAPTVSIGVHPCPHNPGAPQRFQVRCVVSNSCGVARSDAAAYVVCPADMNCDGRLDVGDFLAYLSFYAGADGRADVDRSGGVDVADFLAFLGAYAAGC